MTDNIYVTEENVRFIRDTEETIKNHIASVSDTDGGVYISDSGKMWVGKTRIGVNFQNGSGTNSIQQEGTLANAENSFTVGESTTATNKNQTVVGQYNVQDDDALFIVGAGSDTQQSNAFSVSQYNTQIHNELKVSGNTYVGDRIILNSLDGLVESQNITVDTMDANAIYADSIEAGTIDAGAIDTATITAQTGSKIDGWNFSEDKLSPAPGQCSGNYTVTFNSKIENGETNVIFVGVPDEGDSSTKEEGFSVSANGDTKVNILRVGHSYFDENTIKDGCCIKNNGDIHTSGKLDVKQDINCDGYLYVRGKDSDGNGLLVDGDIRIEGDGCKLYGTATAADTLTTAPSLIADGNNIKVQVGGKNSSSFTVPWANWAGGAEYANYVGSSKKWRCLSNQDVFGTYGNPCKMFFSANPSTTSNRVFAFGPALSEQLKGANFWIDSSGNISISNDWYTATFRFTSAGELWLEIAQGTNSNMRRKLLASYPSMPS